MVRRRKKENKQETCKKKGQKLKWVLKLDEVNTVRNNLLQRTNTGKYRYVSVYKGKDNILRRL